MKKQPVWASGGDVNAFFGLMLDNLAGLILIVTLVSQFGVPTEFCMRNLVPGTAIGVFVGDVLFFVLALWLARKTQRDDVTAMPLGLDTPSTFGMALFVLGPSFLHAKNTLSLGVNEASVYMWEIGICSIFLSGVFKLACAFISKRVQDSVPRAGLLGSLAAIALVLISFLPLLDIMHIPLVGFVALSIVLTSLIAKLPLPGKLPGSVAALLVAGIIFAIMRLSGLIAAESSETGLSSIIWLPQDWMAAFEFKWLARMQDAIGYLPILIPFALATIVGGIDCAESAKAAGDEYPTGVVIGVEAVATLVASCCGGVVQTTPYIGHPAYKIMGGRAAYVLATAFFIGSAGVLGFFCFCYQFIPQAAVYPILVFIGIEITAQSFLVTPRRHYPAVALACVPALATLSVFFVGQIFADATLRNAQIPVQMEIVQDANGHDVAASVKQGITAADLVSPKLRNQLTTAGMIANGFLLTSLFWSSALALAIDRRLIAAAIFLLIAGFCSLVGLIHSPLSDNAMFVPFAIPGLSSTLILPSIHLPIVLQFAFAYFLTAAIFVVWHWFIKSQGLGGPLPDADNNIESH